MAKDFARTRTHSYSDLADWYLWGFDYNGSVVETFKAAVHGRYRRYIAEDKFWLVEPVHSQVLESILYGHGYGEVEWERYVRRQTHRTSAYEGKRAQPPRGAPPKPEGWEWPFSDPPADDADFQERERQAYEEEKQRQANNPFDGFGGVRGAGRASEQARRSGKSGRYSGGVDWGDADKPPPKPDPATGQYASGPNPRREKPPEPKATEPPRGWPPPPKQPPPRQPTVFNVASTAHSTLYVTTDAPPEVIEAAYRALIKKNHPDVGGNHETAAKINAAYDKLKKK